MAGGTLRAGLMALSVFAVAACGTGDEPPPGQICPRISVLGDADTLTRFAAGPGRDLTDVDFELQVVDIQFGCAFVEDVNDNPILAVAVAPVFEADRGPANADREARFQYFVAIADPGQRILNKRVFDMRVEFPGNRSRVTVSPMDPPVSVDIPPRPGLSGPDYHVFIGLQLTPDELGYNRRRRGAEQ